TIMGWNSWFAYQKEINLKKYQAASNFIKSLENFNEGGVSYVNFDAFWTALSKDELRIAAKTVIDNGQIPGIYLAPFATWGKLKDFVEIAKSDYGEIPKVSGFENTRWVDILLKDENGNILPTLDDGYALDVSHPVVLKRMEDTIRYFESLGFKYVKLDFLGHGALEGVHYDSDIQTGLEAYNMAMKKLSDICVSANMFISLSIAPTFPGGYGHARRISCDVFGKYKDSEYELNSLTYGFWQNKNVYEFTDPDHLCFCEGFGEAKFRFMAGVISGTLMLLSDKIEDTVTIKNTREILAHNNILELSRKHVAFRPVRSGKDEKAANLFTAVIDGMTYLAIFNYENIDKKFKILPSEIDLKSENGEYEDMWTCEKHEYHDMINITLSPNECAILSIK
ncbi:MAG: hypothetical protein RR145_05385, partial [Oscillospiraceae bacterium]